MQHAVGRYDRTSLAWAHESPRGELQDNSTRFRILDDFGKLILSGCLSNRIENPGGCSEKNQTCCDALKQGSDEWLDQHRHLLETAQYSFEVPKYAQLATMQHKPKHSELRAGDVRALLRKLPRRTPKESHMRQTRDTGIGC
jgi:hypothetical protein